MSDDDDIRVSSSEELIQRAADHLDPFHRKITLERRSKLGLTTQRITYHRNLRDHPFDEEDVAQASEWLDSVETTTPGTTNRAWVKRLRGRKVYLGTSVGGQPWWLPRGHLQRRRLDGGFSVGLGWLVWNVEVIVLGPTW